MDAIISHLIRLRAPKLHLTNWHSFGMVDHPNKKTLSIYIYIKIDIAWKRQVLFLTIPLEGVFSHTLKIEDIHRFATAMAGSGAHDEAIEDSKFPSHVGR